MVKKEKVTIYERDILDALAEELYGRYHLDGELRVSLQRKWKPVKASSHDWLLQINELPVGGVKSSIILKFEVIEGNITIGQWQLHCDVNYGKKCLRVLAA